MTQHKPESGFEHRFVGLLQACFIIERENFSCGLYLFESAGEEAVDLHPVDGMRLGLFHAIQSAKHAYSARRF